MNPAGSPATVVPCDASNTAGDTVDASNVHPATGAPPSSDLRTVTDASFTELSNVHTMFWSLCTVTVPDRSPVVTSTGSPSLVHDTSPKE